MVNWLVPGGVTGFAVNESEAPAGRPPTVKVTGSENP